MLSNIRIKSGFLQLPCCAFGALTLLGEQQEGHPACKKLSAGMVICLG